MAQFNESQVTNTLKPNQLGGFHFIIKHKRCVLIMGMGTGKTLTTLSALGYLKANSMLTGKTLVVSTKRIAENVWSEEVEKWSSLTGLETVSRIVGDEKKRLKALNTEADLYTISADSVEWLMALPRNLRPFKTIIYDELSLYKNSKIFSNVGYNKRVLFGMGLSKLADRVIGLTGTPISSGFQDLYSEYMVIDLGATFGTNRWGFIRRYFIKNEYTGARREKEGTLQALEKLIAPITYTVKGVAAEKNYSLFLREFDLHPTTLDYYYSIANNYACSKLNIITENGLTKHNLLRQLSSGFVYDWQGNTQYCENTKIEALKEFWTEIGEAPLLLFCEFKAELASITQAFPKKKIALLKDDGAITKWNKGQLDILIANPKSAAHGLNLQTGGYNICYYTMPLSPELFYQSIARLARMGQKFTVNVCCLAARGTADAEQYYGLQEKGMTQAKMIERLDNFRMLNK